VEDTVKTAMQHPHQYIALDARMINSTEDAGDTICWQWRNVVVCC